MRTKKLGYAEQECQCIITIKMKESAFNSSMVVVEETKIGLKHLKSAKRRVQVTMWFNWF
jgi:hypothetical protein